MERVIERLGLVKIELNDQIVNLLIHNKKIEKMIPECKDPLLKKIMISNYEDNLEIINDAKLDIEEIDQVVEVLTTACEISEMHKKRPQPGSVKVN